jgi:hypothetical protein
MSEMTTDHVNAYRNERMAHAHLKRQQREAVLANRANRAAAPKHPMRTAAGNRLIGIGKRLAKTSSPMSATINDMV